jgi:hypothetical protein
MDSSANFEHATPAPDPGSLGNTAKSSSPPDAKSKRAERYEGLAVARFWLGKHVARVDPDRNPGDVYRTHDCRYVRRARTVDVHYAAQFQSSHYSNLATCGSVWACPLCCSLIQQRRRPELTRLVSWSYENDYRPAMVTFTFPHTGFDSLADLKASQKAAFVKLRSGKAWVKFKDRCGFGGLVRSLEVTHGKNGWHPHTHELWLIKHLTPTQEATFLADLRERWMKCCVAAGLLDPNDQAKVFHFQLHSVDVRFGAQDSDYLAKQDSSRAWGVDREIVTSSSKAGRAKGVHPHEFLIRREKGDAMRYLEYVHAMAGSRQLYWSPGLKKLVGVDDIEDEVLALETNEKADLLGSLSADEWAVVRHKRLRAQLLDIAESGDWSKVQDFLIRVAGISPDGRGALPYPYNI